MSLSQTDQYLIANPGPEHFAGIQKLCKKVYPFTKPWSLDQLEAHHTYFPDGQLVVIDKTTGEVIGLAFSLIISWDDYSPQDNWKDFTSGGYFHNHNPMRGKTLYGAEVMVDPEYRGQGIGKMLYRARQEIAHKYELKRIRAGARLRGYHKHHEDMSPEEYTQKVVNREISDPTLSFQLSQGFVVLDVAKNYLINDPESLGYAAVIEWLNPELATPVDCKKQKESIQHFLTNQKYTIEYLPRELRRLVRKVTLMLGRVIREYEGDKFYHVVENYRQRLKKTRLSYDLEELQSLVKKLKKHTKPEQLKLAHSFSLLLELVNSCESAYRTWRQHHKPSYMPTVTKSSLNYVLTAHPTEARSTDVVKLFSKLTNLFVDGLHNDFSFHDAEISSYLRMLWHYPMVKYRKTTVESEADYIYSIIFSEGISHYLLNEKGGFEISLSTWVGGDKDGHPGVDDNIMLDCLQGSRRKLLDIIQDKLNILVDDLKMLAELGENRKLEIRTVGELIRQLKGLSVIKSGDAERVAAWQKKYQVFVNKSKRLIARHYITQTVNYVLKLFPGMVLPIELRENIDEIYGAHKDKNSAIRRMLTKLGKIAAGGSVNHYARSFIISHCATAADISAANRLAKHCLGSSVLRIVPLFEDREAIVSARNVISEWLQTKANLNQVKRHWNNKFEVMLGYSDSAKQVGMLPSRYLIREAMFAIEKVLLKEKIQPVFFHGSGGSVERGGGSLREQISWWPNSAAQSPKMTVQGEMIQRSFATSEILHSQCLHLSNEARLRKARKAVVKKNPILDKFVNIVENAYTSFVDDRKLIEYCLDATPYHYLNVLKIGSRPARRNKGALSVKSLRAIPWILCWTQTRILLPSWWGVGSAWQAMNRGERLALIEMFEHDPFFSSFVKALGYTLAKVEMSVWQEYLLAAHGKQAQAIFPFFEDEYRMAVRFVRNVTKSRKLISHRPWLEESIDLRAPYVNILNLLQIIAMQNQDEQLLKETLVGIACGMLTTG